jgi:3-phenylpropionate/trans-cinnamate dioxygenase ferredoxin reductase subunit
MAHAYTYLIIGGGLAGANAARAIRERDTSGSIALVGAERYPPYHRPPLSKGYLAGREGRSSVFEGAHETYIGELKTDLLLGRRAMALDPAARRVVLDDGEAVSYERLLLATGGEPRRLGVPGGELGNLLYLRELPDSTLIQRTVRPGARVVVVGGGFIGAEVAATLRGAGAEVTLLINEDVLLQKALGREAGRFLSDYFAHQGVTVRPKTPAAAFLGEDVVQAVKTADGEEIPADVVVVGIGITPRVGLAAAAGLTVDDGIVVDQFLCSSDPHIYAAGDVAAFPDRRYGDRMRFEHWDNAIEQGKVAGTNMAGAEVPYDHVPYFFSDQFKLDIQSYGDLRRYDTIVVRGDTRELEDPHLGLFYLSGEKLMGVLFVNADEHDLEQAQKLVAAQTRIDRQARASLADPTAPLDALAKEQG